MSISTRCHYACKALLELSYHWPSAEPLRIQEISEKQDIPTRYLVQILIQLKKMGLVVSSRGKGGGYNLAQAPGNIALGSVVRQIEGPLLPVAKTVTADSSVFTGIWKEAAGAISEVLDNVTFEEILARANGREEAIMYQI